MKRGIGKLTLKIVLGIVVVFLVLVAVKDWAPKQTTVEKTVTYGHQ